MIRESGLMAISDNVLMGCFLGCVMGKQIFIKLYFFGVFS